MDNFRAEYWSDADAKIWREVLANANREEVWAIIKLMHPKAENCNYFDDCEIYSWVEDTHCFSITMNDPPHWLTVKLFRKYIENNYEH